MRAVIRSFVLTGSAIAFAFSNQASAQIPAAEDDAPSEAVAPAALRVYDLDALIALATQHSPSVEAAKRATEAADARLGEATWSPYMQLNGTASFAVVPGAQGSPIFSRDDQFPINNPWGPAVKLGIEGAIPIWTFGKLTSVREAARAGINVAAAREDLARVELSFQVRRAYFGLALALDTLQMLSEGKGKLERAVAKLEERIDADDPEVNELDRYRLSSTLAEVEARHSEATRLERSSRAALAILTGQRDFDVPDCPMEAIAFSSLDADHYVNRAIDVRPEARQMRAGLRVREANLEGQAARYFPDLALALSASFTYTPGVTDQHNPFVSDAANGAGYGLALVLKWPLDFVGAYFRETRARLELEDSQLMAAEAENLLRLDIAATLEELRDAQRREAAWGRGERDTRAWFIASAQAYEIGALEPKDLIDAIKAYFNARFSHLSATRDLNTSIAKLERSVGDPILGAEGRWEPVCEAPAEEAQDGTQEDAPAAEEADQTAESLETSL